MDCSERKVLFSRETLPLWLGLFVIVVAAPFSIMRVGPLPSFFLEAGSLLGCLILVAFTLLSGSLKTRIPAASYYFVTLAIFWAAQARMMQLTYIGMSDMAAWTFAILALLCWACRGWVARLGAERAVSVLAGVLLLGAVLQAMVGWLQYTDLAGKFHGVLMYRKGIVEGQLAQRNHFAHYLMWGMLAAGWLWAQRRLAWFVAVPLMLLIAATMGLTGSRTIFGYVLAMLVLLPLYRLFSGCLSTRAVWGLGLAAAIVLLGQFAVEPVLDLFREGTITSAADRISSGSQIAGSGRGYEWQKAWQIFLSAPWFGHGWGSYPLYGFLTNVYPTTFRPYETDVLFTHSHNSFLNLLAEMGIVGTALVLLGMLWAIRGCFQRANAPVGVFILALMSVSLVHSTLEYPLWYIYFLSIFALFIGFAPASAKTPPAPLSSGSLKTVYAATALAIALLSAGIVYTATVYQDLRQFSASGGSTAQQAKNIAGLQRIARHNAMLRYYAHFQLISHFDPGSATVPPWAEEAAESLRYRPYANAQRYAFAAYRAGKIQAARDWMILMYHYYPSKFSAYASQIMDSPYYPQLQADFTAQCRAYYASVEQIPICAQAAPAKPAIEDVLKNLRAMRGSGASNIQK